MSWNFHVAFKESNSQSQMYHILECFSFDRNGQRKYNMDSTECTLGNSKCIDLEQTLQKQKYQSSFMVNECQTFSVSGHAIEHDLTFSV